MTIVSLFSEESLSNLFHNNFHLDTKKNLKYLVRECSQNKNILHLNIASENGDLTMDYLMVKVLDKENIDNKKLEYADKLEGIYTIRDDNGDVYLGFRKKGILYPSRNNLETLTTILKSLAEFQANYLAKRNERGGSNEYNVKDVSDAVVSLEFFTDLDQNYLGENISRLQKAVDEILKASLLVKSIIDISINNVLINASGKCVFLDLGREALRSPVYDALILIFALSDESFRQHHLKTLLNLYYGTFIKFLEKNDITVFLNMNINVFEDHVKTFLPVIKFETATYLNSKEKSDEEERLLEELLNNISYCLKYHQISYEDCLEAIAAKVQSTEFNLLSYKLIPIEERNGHIGEYFILKSKVNYNDKKEEFNMFMKVLNINDSHLREIVQSGASKKEQFFYRTLIPLFKQHNLQSLINFAPDCYFDRLNDIVIQENLVKLGYRVIKPDERFGYDFLKTAFFKVARLHACSIILEERMSKSEDAKVRLCDIYEDYFQDWIFTVREGLPRTPLNVISAKPGLDELIDTFEDIPKDISIEEFHKRVNVFYDMLLVRVNSPAKQFTNVLNHGDMYSSNLLAKYDQDNVVEDCFLIDYQTFRYAPVAQDLLMLAYCSATKPVRDKYLNRLLEEYYQELKNILSEFNIDINKFYTPKQFTACVEYMKPIMIIVGIIYAQVCSIPAQEKKEIFFSAEKASYYLFENRKEFIKLFVTFSKDLTLYVKELIEDLYDICVNSYD